MADFDAKRIVPYIVPTGEAIAGIFASALGAPLIGVPLIAVGTSGVLQQVAKDTGQGEAFKGLPGPAPQEPEVAGGYYAGQEFKTSWIPRSQIKKVQDSLNVALFLKIQPAGKPQQWWPEGEPYDGEFTFVSRADNVAIPPPPNPAGPVLPPARP